MKQNELSIYQILVLCGTREIKHNKRIATKIGKTENYVSTWPTRGIPYQYWELVSEFSGVNPLNIADAQAHTLGTKRKDEYGKYIDADQLHVDSDAS